ncbi:MAG: hypothetical protein QOK47_172 [Actinomycetota bacterium]|nr:hypothetical protein [Actinomycetota bacterium]
MRQHRLLRSAQGSAPVETVFALTFVLLLVLGVIEVAFALYGRNVVMASAHEGARAAVEYGRSSEEAEAIARDTVRRAAGSLVDDLQVSVSIGDQLGVSTVQVRVQGTVDAFGPVPFPMSVDSVATAAREGLPR